MIYDDNCKNYKKTREAILEYILQEERKGNVSMDAKAYIKELAFLHFDMFSERKPNETVSML